jgi:gliding motility-associated-like protein
MPISSNAFQSTPANGFDFYLAVFDRDFDGLLYGSYLGGNQAQEHVDGGTSRFDKNGIVYQSVCGGCGGHSDFPTTNGAWSNQNLSTNCNTLVFKFDFDLLPTAEFTTTDLIGCADFEVNFTNNSPPSDSYLWDFGNGDTTSTIYSPTVTYTSPGNYLVQLMVTDSICLLTDTAQINITVLPELSLAVSNDTILCSPMSITFTANSNGTSNQFIWSSNSNFADTLNSSIADSTLTVIPTETTTYYVQIGNAACAELDSVTVYFVGGSLSISGNDSICLNNPTNLTANINVPGVTFDYVWSPSSVITTTTQDNIVSVNPPTSQWIYCDANGSNGCFDRDSIFVTVGNLGATVTATADPTVVVPGETSLLVASPSGFNYSWTPTQGLTSPNSQQTLATVSETTDYTVSVSDGICTESATVQVKVMSVVCDRTFVYVPNAFSPNGDGKNDLLKVRSAIATEIEFKVFNRWGELVFETTDINVGWDGTFRGRKLDPDVYDYYLKAVCVGGTEEIIKGNITLLK